MPEPDPAATVLALRPLSTGFEVLMVQRNSRGFFGGLAVFPGGRVEDVDVPPGLSPDDDLPHRNAALREFAEETGILITASGTVTVSGVRDHAYYEWLDEHGHEPDVDGLVLVSRWVTPEIAPRRFDARFYVAICDDPPEVEIDTSELIGHEWVTPGDALERHVSGTWSMMRPTIAHLRWLRRWSSVEEVLRSAQGADGRTLIVPRVVDDGSLLPIHMPAELP
ncbi:MAG: NUDIX hydrolase [Actinomycetota bacterium]